MEIYYLCYTFKLTSTFNHTFKVTTERTSALPLKSSSLFREGATSATSTASPKVYSRHTLLDRKSKRGHLPEKIFKKTGQNCLIVVKIHEN